MTDLRDNPRPASEQPHVFGDAETELEAWYKYKRYPYLLAKGAFYGTIFVAIYLVLGAVESVAFPLFLSIMIAYLLDPLIDRFEERKIDRTVAILIVILALFVGMSVLVAFLYPLVSKQVLNVIEKFPALFQTLRTETIPWFEKTTGAKLPETLGTAFDQYSNELKSAAPTVFKNVASWTTGLLGQTGVILAGVLNMVMIPIFTFYFLRDFDIMKAKVAEYVPVHTRNRVFGRLSEMDEVIGAWFRGQIQVGFILSLMYGVGLGISFGATGHSVFDGFALGVVSGLLNVIPYLGFAVGFVLSVLVVVIEWTGWGALIGVLVVFAVVQGLEGYVITPKIVGEKVGLSPVTVIIVLLVGGEVGGLLGVLLALPVAGAIKVVLPDIIDWYKKSPYFRGTSDADVARAMMQSTGVFNAIEVAEVLRDAEAEAEAEVEASAEADVDEDGVRAPEDELGEDAVVADEPGGRAQEE